MLLGGSALGLYLIGGVGTFAGLAMIFLLLSFVFKSYLEPLIVMTAIPFGLIGAIFGHLVMGLDLTMPSVIGFVSLSGIVVNDSIVLVSFIKLRLAEGKDVLDAIRTSKDLSDDTAKKLKDVVDSFAKSFA